MVPNQEFSKHLRTTAVSRDITKVVAEGWVDLSAIRDGDASQYLAKLDQSKTPGPHHLSSSVCLIKRGWPTESAAPDAPGRRSR